MAKRISIINQMNNTLKEICYGTKYFETALVLRESEFVNGILTNLEVAYGLNEQEIIELEKIDEILLRKCLKLQKNRYIWSWDVCH